MVVSTTQKAKTAVLPVKSRGSVVVEAEVSNARANNVMALSRARGGGLVSCC